LNLDLKYKNVENVDVELMQCKQMQLELHSLHRNGMGHQIKCWDEIITAVRQKYLCTV